LKKELLIVTFFDDVIGIHTYIVFVGIFFQADIIIFSCFSSYRAQLQRSILEGTVHFSLLFLCSIPSGSHVSSFSIATALMIALRQLFKTDFAF
jgi:hypothetical protein